MTAPARLLGLRVQGFKSFAERTLVEFGPGISAVVGPNGSGKSNLADALRWALGEQGRSLRIRKSEDVIWAGSEKRSAQGMADVTLVLDNADGLLPVEYSVLELGRRLYRSGENDYLLNRQRVRLRDLQDLLDAANLADNAFLFIGQGMVDQALALRPEERRPLFEEVAGVRRHERRRRKAEEQLAEAEGNLARVEDILAELRPQARRLGQLAEQQATRLTAGEELAASLIAAAHGRWHEAAGRAAAAETRRDALRAETGAALDALETAESAVAEIATSMATRAEAERDGRVSHEATRGALTALGLREARAAGEIEAAARDRQRIAAERAAAETDLALQRRILAEVVPERDLELEAALAEADRALAEALSELTGLRAASRARGDELAAVRRAEASREAEAETARRRAAESTRRAADERARATESEARRDRLETVLAAARQALAATSAEEVAAVEARGAARSRADAAEGTRRAVAERAARAGTMLAGSRGRLEQLTRRLAEEEDRGIARAARRLGGTRIDEELGVEPALRAAVEAALGELARAYLVEQHATGSLAAERGHVIVRERLAAGDRTPGGGSAAELRRLDESVAAAGGGRLVDAVRRDPTGAVRAILGRVVWVPDLAAALAVQPSLPLGWLAVPRDGDAVVDPLAVRLGRAESPLERRAEADRLSREVEVLQVEADTAEAEAHLATTAAAEARQALEQARAAESAAASARRRDEDAERAAGRELEAGAREAAWHAAQADRLASDAERATAALAVLEARPGDTGPGPDAAAGEQEAVAAWEARAAELRARRDGIASDVATQERARREAEGRRARAEAAVTLAEGRIAAASRDVAALADRERQAGDERDEVAGELAAAAAHEAAARATLEALLADDRAERARLAEAERAATAARERLRAADDRARGAEVAAMEGRLSLDALREQLLVELAGLGEVGLRHLAEAAGIDPATDEEAEPVVDAADDVADAGDDGGDAGDITGDTRRLETALDALVPRWAAAPPAGDLPSPGRLAVLRRRYHELGAANPFAVDEYRGVRERLETLDAQDKDLREAISRTRQLIADLDELIATQFRATFAQLEVAFDARFQQLFGGGFAKLVLTDPGDLSATGIEITARPPGKKAQALSMLSGGERALTAVALLFAMLEVRPAPFCVLDEVDAALDEANVGRFTQALRALTAHTQFIVITHNRGTIEAADALYGVTVGDDSVSRVISLRLDEAQAIADTRRTDAQPVMAGEAG
ncbi:MAG TPA: chromosome segregation protein SMC [Candidatus Limnocylindrales bacterium]|nr:chromosome segregation protein SMC [Candidatus Limnocylindrales bacterium]